MLNEKRRWKQEKYFFTINNPEAKGEIIITFVDNQFASVDFRNAINASNMANGSYYSRGQWDVLKAIAEKITELEGHYERQT